MALGNEFDEEMLNIYRRALAEAHYNASRFLQVLNDHCGIETARRLVLSTDQSEGYTALYLRGRLDLTVEAVIYDNPKWYPLFTADELAACKKRLKDCEYIP